MRPDAVITPVTAPASVKISFAATRTTRTPAAFTARASASATSLALSETGNTRPPRSVLSGTPSDSNSTIVSRGDRRLSALYKNLPSPGICRSSVCTSQSFVTLQRPLPVMRTLRPSVRFGSSSTTSPPPQAAI